MTDQIDRRKLIGIGAGALIVAPLIGCNQSGEQATPATGQPTGEQPPATTGPSKAEGEGILIPLASAAELARPALAACYRLHCYNEIIFLRHGLERKQAYLSQYDSKGRAPHDGALYDFILEMGSQPVPAVVKRYWDELLVKEVPETLYLPSSSWQPRPSVPQPRFRVLAYLYEQVINKLRIVGGKPVDRDGMRERLASELGNPNGKPEPIVW